jgi:type II secretory pathway component PulC
MRIALLSGRDAASKIPVIIIATVFASLIALQAYYFWKSLRSGVTPITTAVLPAHNTQDTPNIGKLAASHLFGDVQEQAPQDSEIKEDKSLNLTLRGIVANSGANTSLAIIESKPNGEETFALGDDVFNKGKLNTVAIDYVILLLNNGQLARLQLPEQEAPGVSNEEYLPQAQPDYVEPESVAPAIETREPAAVAQPEAQPETETQVQPEAQPESETPAQPETTTESTDDNKDATPAQP